jgi:catechol 2,3-dioxygenase-like lactoylglutathione lyase family enzyme
MKRFHVHVSVNNLSESIGFYSGLFGLPPSVEKPDYAKWMLDDPRVNFAISQRGHQAGVNHLGFQVDSDDELAQLRSQVDEAGLATIDQTATACCYASSNKHWLQDPQGIAWETFHTLGPVSFFGDENPPEKATESACCVPLAQQPEDIKDSACCVPASSKTSQQKSCCD